MAVTTAVKWTQRQRARGSVPPRKVGGHRRPLLREQVRIFIVRRIAEKPDLTVRALQAELLDQGLKVSHDCLKAESLSCRKKTVFAQEQMRPKTVRFRARWKAHQHRFDPRRFIFADETWIKTNMTRTHCWSKRGTPLQARVPHGNWQTLTFLAGLRLDRIEAPWVLDGPINRESFEAWVETQLSLNPIEQAFAKLRTLIRKAEARTAEDLCRAAGRVLGTFTPAECSNYLRNAVGAGTRYSHQMPWQR